MGELILGLILEFLAYVFIELIIGKLGYVIRSIIWLIQWIGAATYGVLTFFRSSPAQLLDDKRTVVQVAFFLAGLLLVIGFAWLLNSLN
ncbi:MAG: hypothetical protein AAFP19_24260 [Bacteroidota bacterium]